MDLPISHRVRVLAALLVSALIATLTLAGGLLPAAAADGTLSGTVTEAGSGAPLGGVSIQAYCWNVPGSISGEVCGQTDTAADGTYSLSLAPGTYKVRFDHWPNHGAQYYGGGSDLGDADSLQVTVPDGGAASGIDAALAPLREITGTVTGSGEQLGGINVTAYQHPGPLLDWQPGESAVTAPDGTYTLRVPDGTYRVGFADARGPYQTVFFDGAAHVEGANDVVVAGAGVSGIDADMALNYPITGAVTVEGIDMPGVTVTAWREDASAPDGWEAVKVTETGEDGRYALYLPDGTYRVEFKTFQDLFDTVYFPGVSTLDAAADVVVAGAEVPGISVAIVSGEVDSGPAITGTVTVAGSGAPAGGVSVTAWRWNVLAAQWVQVRQRFTADDGTYALYVPEGTYRVGFGESFGRYRPIFYGGAATVEDADDVVQPSEGVTGIDARLVENHSIAGSIIADPLPQTVVTAWRWNAVSSDWERANDVSSSPDGHYALYLPDGTYRIEFTSFSSAYQRPHFYDGTDNIGEATDVVLAGVDVTNIDAQLVPANTEPPPTWASADTLSPAGADAWTPQIAVGPDGTTVALWAQLGGGRSRVQASGRAVNGAWTSPTVLSSADQDAFDPQVSVGPDGMFVAVWRRWDGNRYRAQASTRTATGSWSSPVTLSGAGTDAWDPQVVVGDKGAAVAVWRGSDGTGSQVQASTRGAKGSWSAPVVLSSGGDAWDPQVAAAADGAAVAVWSRSDGAHYRVQAAALSKKGTWSSPATLSAAGQDAEDPQVTVASDGAASVVWRRSDGVNERIEAASRTSGGAWSAPATLSTAGRDAHDPQVAVDPNGTVSAVWARWDGSSDRVQASSRVPAGTWATPKTLSMGGQDANAPQVAAGPDGKATAVWHQAEDFGEFVLAAIRNPDASWSVPTVLTPGGSPTYGPQVATGSDGTVAAVWEQRDGAHDRVQGVVRMDVGEPDPGHCRNEFDVDLNLVFGLDEQFVVGACTTVTAGTKWRPLTLWFLNTAFEGVPPGYVPAGATPLEDFILKLESIRVVVDRGMKGEKAVSFSPPEALRTDLTYDDYDPNGYPWPIAVTIPRLAPLPSGHHTVQVIWRLNAQHCPGFFEEEEFFCLPSGNVSEGTRSFTVVSR